MEDNRSRGIRPKAGADLVRGGGDGGLQIREEVGRADVAANEQLRVVAHFAEVHDEVHPTVAGAHIEKFFGRNLRLEGSVQQALPRAVGIKKTRRCRRIDRCM